MAARCTDDGPRRARSSATGIDFSDIPELDAGFWERAEPVEPSRTDQVTMRVKSISGRTCRRGAAFLRTWNDHILAP